MATKHEHTDNLIGTFAVITPEEWAEVRAELEPMSIDDLWLSYKRLLEDIQLYEFHLSDPDSFMEPDEIPECIPERIIQWDKQRQMVPFYEEILHEKNPLLKFSRSQVADSIYTRQEHTDELIGTFAVITPEEWAEVRAELEPMSIGHLWLAYEHLLEDIRFDEWHLSDPDSFMEPGEIPERIIQWDKERQMVPLYEEILREKGWNGRGIPEGVPCCRVCDHRMSHSDRRAEVCDECDMEMMRDELREWQREESRYR